MMFFFVKQKTAYEMRISDWSSDVCSSDLWVAEPEALALIARAAEGSARDGLSILDQAIAHAGMEGGGVSAETVRQMLGLSDRGAMRALMGLMLAAGAPGARPEERRGRKKWVRACGSRWRPLT